jgi:hypothetical protein
LTAETLMLPKIKPGGGGLGLFWAFIKFFTPFSILQEKS